MAKFLPSSVKIVKFRGEPPKSGFVKSVTDRLSHVGIDALLCPSTETKEYWSKKFTGSVKKVQLGTDSNFYRYNPELSRSNELLIVGRFDPVKGQKEFMKILSETLRSWPEGRPKPKLVLIGRSENISGQELVDYGHSLGLTGDEVEIIDGSVPDIVERMNKARLGVVSSLGSEIICRVSQEFQLCGTPLLVSGVGSLNEAMVPNGGLSYKNDNLDLIKTKLQQAFFNDYDREKISSLAKDKFSIITMSQNLTEILNQLFFASA